MSDMTKAIENLVADLTPVRPLQWTYFAVFVAMSMAVSAVLILGLAGPRADFTATFSSVPLMWKTLAPLALSVLLGALVLRASRPGAHVTRWHWLTLGTLLAIFWIPGAVGFVRDDGAAVLDADPRGCLSYVSLAALVPLGFYLLWLRQAAPVQPVRAGALAGFAAGAIGAFAFANHCPHLEYQYVAIFYSLPSVWLAAVGAIAARFLCKW